MNITLNDEQLSCSQPSLAAALDVVSIWGINPSRAHVGRLCAAASGRCCQEARLPRYSMIDAAPIPYGGRVLEQLLARGIHAEEISTQGLELIVWMAGQLPQAEEVEKSKAFLPEKEEDTSSG